MDIMIYVLQKLGILTPIISMISAIVIITLLKWFIGRR